ncbi:hypothetical protein K3495_g7407 [Podosphaera aphanis]|nr:hypothetical protein K3495_g7407 [Podosphaera aphanis]
MYIKVKIGNETLVALIDTGASGVAFVSQSLCHRLLLPSEKLEPLAVIGFEDLPWLEKHSPYINWKENTITFGEPCIESLCCNFETTITHHNPSWQALQSTEKAAKNSPSLSLPNINAQPKIRPISPEVFVAAIQEPGTTHFALSLRDLDIILADLPQRLPSLRVRNATMVIPKDANPRDFLPYHYHEFLDVFDRKQANLLPPHRPWDHAIDLQPGNQPPVSRPYSMNRHELEALRKYLDQELAKGFIRVSRSPAVAPVLFVKKSNGDLRFCIDYRGLNAISIKNRHALPLISETLNQLSRAKYYNKLDVISAFNKLRIKGDEWKAAFTCRYGLFEPLVLPFGICSGPASFQAHINHALRGLLDQFCTAYMDDILIYSSSLEEHRRHVKTILQRLREHGLQVDISKCDFETTQVTYLGLIVSTKGIHMDPKKVACIQEWPTPRSVRDVQGFLGFANFYRRFIPEFSRIAAPLTNLTKEEAPFSWNDLCKSSFLQIKHAIKDGGMLAHFDPSRRTILETDASDYVTAAVLLQYDDSGILRPVAFMSKKRLPAECNYEIFNKELLAVVHAFETWTAELGSVESSTLILTDHKNLEQFTTTKKLNRRQVRWNELLSDYDFKIVFRPGKLGAKPDALTRISANKPIDNEDDRNKHQYQTLLKLSQILRSLDTKPITPIDQQDPATSSEISLENWKEHCKNDKFCQEIRSALMSPKATRSDIQLASCKATEHSFIINDKEYVPEALRELMLKQLHDSPLYGHRGAVALYCMISRRYWWPNCHRDSKNTLAAARPVKEIIPRHKNLTNSYNHCPPLKQLFAILRLTS